VAIVAALVGAADLVPWMSLVFWLIACALFVRVVASAGWHLVLRILTAAVAVSLALGLWWRTSARADVRVVELVPAQQRSDRSGSFDVNIVFQNMGEWPADVRAVSQIGVYEAVPFEDVERRAALEDHVRRGLALVPESSAVGFRVAPYERRYYTVSGELSKEQLDALRSGRLTAYIAAEIRYRDWWVRDRGTRVCAFTSGGVHAIVQCLRYSESW
jgi:hypothetical protein